MSEKFFQNIIKAFLQARNIILVIFQLTAFVLLQH